MGIYTWGIPKAEDKTMENPNLSLLDNDDVGGDTIAVDPHRPRLGDAALAPRVHHRHRVGSAVVHLDVGHVVDGRQEIDCVLGHVRLCKRSGN